VGKGGRKLRGRALAAVVLGAATAVALTGAADLDKPATVPLPRLEFIPNGRFAPRVLSKSTPTPIALAVSAKVGTVDGSHPPALRELTIGLDKNIAIDLKGYPTCHGLGVQVDPPMTPQEECRGAFIGKGTAHFEIHLSESEPIQVQSALQIFNLGRKEGDSTFVALAHIAAPTAAVIIVTIKIKKRQNGRYGTEAAITIPKIAGGSGSITHLNLRIKKQLPFEGQRFSPVTARCPDGKLRFHDTATFFNYESSEALYASSTLPRICTGR
jgi:hypothetical protein